MELNPLHLGAISIERLIEPDPAFGAATIGRGKELEAGDVAARAAKPRALVSELDPEIGIGAFDMESVYLGRKCIQLLAIGFELVKDTLPLFDRVGFVEEARFDDLVPVFVFGETRLVRHRLGAVEPDGPSELAFVFLLGAPVAILFDGDTTAHDLFGVDAFECMRVITCGDVDRMVDMIDETAHVFGGEEIKLVILGSLEKGALHTLVIVEMIVRDHVPTCLDDRRMERDKKRPCALSGRDAHDLALLDPLAAAQGEID